MMSNISYKSTLSLLALLAFAALSQSCADELKPIDVNQVHLSASMGYVPVKGSATDDSGIIDYDYADALDIALMRIDEHYTASWPAFKNVSDILTATMSAPDSDYKRDISFDVAQFYRNSDDHISYASWYPVVENSVATSSESTTVTFPLDGSTDVLYGTIAEGNKLNGFNDVVFNHALCQFNIYVYTVETGDTVGGNDGDSGDQLVVDWGAITSLTIKGVQNQCVMTLPRDDSGKEYEFSYEGSTDLNLHSADNKIYWNPGDAIPLGFDSRRLVSSFIAPPPTEGYIAMSVNTTSALEALQQVSIARNFQRGYAYDIVLRFTSHGLINADVSVGKWNYQSLKGGEKITQNVAADMYYDLSAYRKANCYIVPAGNYGYSFEGNVKGNSSETIAPGYIDVLWSDNPEIWDSSKAGKGDYKADGTGGNYFQMATHSLSKNRIMFKIGNIKDDSDKELKHKGNVVVAAYKDNTKSEILWTWHLWLTDQAGTVGFTNGYLALNLDLGAINEGEPGLYYQWGRKDPFAVASDGNLLSVFSKSSNSADVATTVKNPLTFYGTGDSSNNWYSGSLSDMDGFWGWAGENKNISKSMYDPCPSGYFASDYRLWGTEYVAAYEKGGTYGNNGSVTVEIANRQLKFPLTMGYLNGSATKTLGTNNANKLFIWSSSISSGDDKPYVMLYPESGKSPVDKDEHRNYGGAVRCIARSQSVVRDLSSPQSANSYIIDKDGYYKFRANIAGNGVGMLITTSGNEWDISGKKWGTGEAIDTDFQPDKVSYLWYQPELGGTIPTSITTDDVCLKILDDGVLDENGYVYLEVKDWKPGNVVLAAYKGNTILWSWHFWLTTVNEVSSSYYTMLDRNLGATAAQPASQSQSLASYGLLYQWGRKDPIIGVPASYMSSNSNSLTSSIWFKYTAGEWNLKQQIETVSGPVSTKVASQNPSAMIVSSNYWMSGYNDDSNRNMMNSLWGYAVDSNAQGNVPGKTYYDPCPPGYTVSHHWAFWNSPSTLTYTSVSGSNYTKSGYGWLCDYFTYENSNKDWFALCGYRDYTNGYAKRAGISGLYYTSMPRGNTLDSIRFVQIGDEKNTLNDNKSTAWTGITGSPYGGAGGTSRTYSSFAFAIRCIKQ